MAARTGPFEAVADGVRVHLRLTPRAARTAVLGLAGAPGGAPVLKAAVTAVPEAGKANAALVTLLAGEWGVAKSAITVVAGATSRNKVLHVAGEPGVLLERLRAWAAGLPS